MNEEQLAAIESRANAATPGPWMAHEGPPVRLHGLYPGKVLTCGPGSVVVAVDEHTVKEVAGWTYQDANGRFIAAARTDVPALVREVRRLRRIGERMAATLRACREAIAGYVDTVDGDPPSANWAASLQTDIDVALGDAYPCTSEDRL